MKETNVNLKNKIVAVGAVDTYLPKLKFTATLY
jgi:hypothetical protein